MDLTKRQLARMIDHTLLKPFATGEDIKKLCAEAVAHGFKSVCVNPVRVAEAAALLEGGGPLVCSVVGFPFGTHLSRTKAAEAAEVVRLGAGEVDMVIHVGALKEGRPEDVRRDIRAVVDAAEGRPVKVILETAYLDEAEIVLGCHLAAQAGAAFVKTSTGYGPAGATEAAVRLMRRSVGQALGVKAAGGIRTLADALKMIQAGADRLGASAGVAIVAELGDG